MHSLMIAVFVLGLFLLVVDWVGMLFRRMKMPPGPLPLPIIGNTFQLPSKKPWVHIEALSKQYDSPLITFWIGRTPTVWINDCWTASELLNKRANVYSSRPRLVVLGDLALGQNNLVAMYYGERWRLHRKLTHEGVGLQHLREYRIFQDYESKVTALHLLSTPQNYVAHYERYAASVVSIVGTQKRVAEVDHPIMVDVIGAATQASEFFVPGKHFPIIMETFPIIAKFGPIKRIFREAMAKGRDFYVNMSKQAAVRPVDSYVKKIYNNDRLKYDLSNEEIAALTGNLFGAGTDTSSSTLCTFTLACCAFPETLPKAWEEIDSVVGLDRSPALEDFDKLPYIRAFVKEVFRWRSVAILGGQPHAPIKDDYYKGFLIPRGTSCTGNLWAIHRNEKDFPEPDRFCPDRFFEGHPLNRPFPTEKGYMTFGWGRRVCSGQGLAEQGILLSIARLLWAFRIENAIDPVTGKERKLDIFDYTNGVHIRPQPFECTFTPRSDRIRTSIEREGKQALNDLSKFE